MSIKVEILEEATRECLAMASWAALPNIGDWFYAGGKSYVVVDRGWGVTCDGQERPQWSEQCATLVVAPADEHRFSYTSVLILNGTTVYIVYQGMNEEDATSAAVDAYIENLPADHKLPESHRVLCAADLLRDGHLTAAENLVSVRVFRRQTEFPSVS